VWAKRLAELHDTPHSIRYAHGINGIVTPAKDVMAAGLDEVYAVVGSLVYG
jgi:hypothetical protein